MPVITSIKRQKKKDRVNVYLDDKFGFGIDLDNFVKLDLRVDQQYSQEQIDKFVHEAEFQKTWEKLLRFAMVRPRSAKEVNGWFKRKEVHESMHEELIKKLKHFELLDDTKFAKWWVEQRLSFRKKSKRVIEMELRQKGISKETIDTVLEETPVDEKKVAKELLEKKAYKWKSLEHREARQKMSQYLAGKGFSWEVIEKVVKD